MSLASRADAVAAPTAGIDPPREAPAPLDDPTEHQLGLAWLLRLRWVAVAGQLMTLLVARLTLAPDLPYGALLGLVAVTALTNVVLGPVTHSDQAPRRIPAILAIDVVLLTALLVLSGGATNPFTVFFLVHVALASLLLEARLAWSLLALTVVAFGSLFIIPSTPLPGMHNHGGSPWSAHLGGMWVAYTLSASLVAYFVGKVSRAIRDRDRRLAHVRTIALQNERLATLSSFSANAAHELGTPLATIGLAAKELSLGLEQGKPAESLTADAALVCQEVARCRSILTDLSSRAGESVGEMPVATTARHILDAAVAMMSPRLAPYLQITFGDDQASSRPIVAPPRTLAQILLNLIRNAFEAQEEAGVDGPVEVHVEVKDRLCFWLRDRGAGLSREVREHLGQPFITTKSDLGGLGLGVYLAVAYAERAGGYVRFNERAGGGTEVEMCLARDPVGSWRS